MIKQSKNTESILIFTGINIYRSTKALEAVDPYFCAKSKAIWHIANNVNFCAFLLEWYNYHDSKVICYESNTTRFRKQNYMHYMHKQQILMLKAIIQHKKAEVNTMYVKSKVLGRLQ